MICSVSCVSSSTPASLCSDDQRAVARRSRRARGESDPRAQGNSEGPIARLPAPGLSTASDDQGHPASAGNHPDFHPGTGAAAGRHRGLSGIFAGCVHAGSVRHGQLSRRMAVTVVVRSVPWLTLRYGTPVARPIAQGGQQATGAALNVGATSLQHEPTRLLLLALDRRATRRREEARSPFHPSWVRPRWLRVRLGRWL